MISSPRCKPTICFAATASAATAAAAATAATTSNYSRKTGSIDASTADADAAKWTDDARQPEPADEPSRILSN